MSCADFRWEAGLSDGKAAESSLEAYANAVRVYQSVVLELQAVESQDRGDARTHIRTGCGGKSTRQSLPKRLWGGRRRVLRSCCRSVV